MLFRSIEGIGYVPLNNDSKSAFKKDVNKRLMVTLAVRTSRVKVLDYFVEEIL